MKKYLLYTILLVAFFIGISATASYAAETGDLTVNLGLSENSSISDMQSIGYTVRLTNNGEPVSGTFPIEYSNISFNNPTESVTFDSDGNRYFRHGLKKSDNHYLSYPDKAFIVIKDIPVGTTYEIIPDNKPLDGNQMGNKQSSFIEYYTTDDQTGEISSEGNVVDYTLKPKYTKMVVTYKNTAPDYNTPYISFNLTLHAYSIIPDAIHYYNSSNPDEKNEMEKNVYSNGQTDFISESITFNRGESIIFDDIPIGAQYHITPNGVDPNYSYYYGQPKYMQSSSGQIWGPNGLEYYYWVDVQGSPKKLTITKELSEKGADMTREFTFKLTATSFQRDFTTSNPFKPLNSEYLYNVIDLDSGEVVETRKTKFDDGIAYVQCKAGQKIEIGDVQDLREVTFEVGYSPEIDFANKLYNWTRVTVEEVDCDDYTNQVTPSEIINNLPATVIVTNERKFTGSLTIKKEITEDVPEDEEFTFKIKLTDGATDLPTEYEFTGSKEGTLQFEDGIATITLKGGESITISGLPLKCTYEVQEEGDNYKITKENATGKLEEETIVTITNSKKEEPQEETEEPEDPEDPDDPEEPVKQDDTKGEEKQEEQSKQEEQENVKDNVQEEKNEEDIEEVKEEKKEEQPISENPKTFDNINIIALITLCSLLAFICITKIKKSK